ncbi:hypothetical protein [Actinophytocola sp.]|uniref:hypothetical protein n=1 Tax=Actinophytocola sp. TaxID=1872138 RepID=UPI003D6AD1C0
MDSDRRDVADLAFAVDPTPHPVGHQFAMLATSGTEWAGGDSTYAVDLAGERWVHNCIVADDVAGGEL